MCTVDNLPHIALCCALPVTTQGHNCDHGCCALHVTYYVARSMLRTMLRASCILYPVFCSRIGLIHARCCKCNYGALSRTSGIFISRKRVLVDKPQIRSGLAKLKYPGPVLPGGRPNSADARQSTLSKRARLSGLLVASSAKIQLCTQLSTCMNNCIFVKLRSCMDSYPVIKIVQKYFPLFVQKFI